MNRMSAAQSSSSPTPLVSAAALAFARVVDWDLSAVKQHAVAKGLYTQGEIDVVETAYKKYLAICSTSRGDSYPSPLKVDPLWHEHILFTRDYSRMCKTAFGHFIHHEPFASGRELDCAAQSALRHAYQTAFGEEPDAVWTVFALCSPNPNCENKS